MPDHTDRSAPDAMTGHEAGFLEVQRAGLEAFRDLTLAVVTPAESEVEDRYRRACESAEDVLRSSVAAIERRTRENVSAAEQSQLEQTARIQAEYESARAALAARTQAAVERIATDLRDAEAELDRKLEDQLLLPDTVAQTAFERLRQGCQIVEQRAAEGRKRLEQLHGRAVRELSRYRIQSRPFPAASADSTAAPGDAGSAFERQIQIAMAHLDAMERIRVPRLFMGVRLCVMLTLLSVLVVGGLGALSYFGVAGAPEFSLWGPLSFGMTVTFTLLIGWAVRQDGKARILDLYEPLADAVAAANQALDRQVTQARGRYERETTKASDAEQKNPEKHAIRLRFERLLNITRRRMAESREQALKSQRQLQAELERRRDNASREATAQAQRRCGELRQRCEGETAEARAAYEKSTGAARAQYEAERAALWAAWREDGQRLQKLLAAGDELRIPQGGDWASHELQSKSAGGDFTALIPFGRWQLDLAQVSPSVQELAAFLAQRPSSAATPVLLAVPGCCSLLLQTERAGRQQAIDALRVIMLRLLTALRPGRVRFTILDPVGLGESFAGFMHLVDYEEALVGGRIWTDSEQIEARLTELTSHMENVIQKYLRNEFATIDAYNRQAGQLAEPYRFLVVADFPTNFTEGAIRRLGSIISSGARCGVFTLIMHDRRLGLPAELPLEDLAGNGLRLVHDGERFLAEDELLRHFELVLDAPPPEDVLTRIMHVVGRGAKDAFRVEVPFDAIAPAAGKQWTRDATKELSVPIGHAGAVRLQNFALGRGLAQHALVAGKTGSGKSTLLHVIITNVALWYPPEEVELYLVDFKKGVEFKTYVTHALPHARAIAIESDREFGVSVLQRLDAEMNRRGELFRAAGVQDLSAYRAASGQVLPRTLLIVDEFQIFFTEDDKLAQEAGVLVDRLVRQGRAFGIHILLGSQTLAGSAGLARSTMGQMAVRIALQCSEADSQVILDDTNVAARLLSRPGEAIYNDAGGLLTGNNNFQVAWLPDERQSVYLDDVRALADTRGWRGEPAIVFEGNALADIRQNRQLVRLIELPQWPSSDAVPHAWLGEPVAIKDPTGVALRRQSGANLLAVGQRDEAALAMLAAAMLCLGCQHAPQTARFVILGGAAAEEPAAGGLHDVAALLPHPIQWVEWREVPDVIAELAAETQRRLEQGPGDAPTVYLIIYGLQRYRALRRREESFSFSTSDEQGPPATDRQFAEVLREGPPLGIHVVVWSDTLATLERTLDRQSLREFDNRVLFQMGAADSSNLTDSPEANRLGLYRALFFSEERGLLEKFRPYGALDPEWMKHVQECMKRRAGS
jgi:DNA segregation ATPase FtsK/SpoIIIE, S-DNA-T family